MPASWSVSYVSFEPRVIPQFHTPVSYPRFKPSWPNHVVLSTYKHPYRYEPGATPNSPFIAWPAIGQCHANFIPVS